MSNFEFLQHEFATLKANAVKSEMYATIDPMLSAICSRKAMESSVKFIYKVDEDLGKKLLKGKDFSSLMHDKKFLDILPSELFDEINFVRKLGNKAVHENQEISKANSMYANKCLYKLQRWMVEVYSKYDILEEYDATKLLTTPKKENSQEVLKQSDEQEKLAEENAKLQAQIEQLTSQIDNKKQHLVEVKGLSEKETRQRIIDLELHNAGYEVEKFKHGVDVEYKLTLEDGSTGYADYVIWGENEKPLAVIEAKKASVSVTSGKHQAKRYAKALEKEFGCKVLTFVTNGRVIEYTNGIYPFREIHSLFPKKELIRNLQKREALLNVQPSTLSIDENITDRGYQKRAIKSVLKTYESHQTKALLVMATGTGKTRVSASVSDVLIRAGWVRKVLFLADRKELVKQATNNFKSYLNETVVNLVKEKNLENRMHFGTYETVHNLIRDGKYNSAYFDLIIVDEAHRTIYKKYRAIFEYFDAFVLGLTATPADEVHRNTYDFFGTGDEPTDSYGLSRAIDDGYLVKFNPYEIDLGIVKKGIKYSELSSEEQEQFEEKFDEEEDEISSSEINERVLNKQTNELVLQHLHKNGFKVDEGNKIGKTIIFAKNKQHAEYIKKVFDSLYPSRAEEAQLIHSDISHVENLLTNFKKPDKNPQIAISVDMLDTGIDVPELLNLVFFKPVKSKIKFWQMIGRGTRLSPNLFGEGEDKTSFNIFDFCNNFYYFGMNADGEPAQLSKSLKERLFLKRISLLKSMEESDVKADIRAKVQSQVYALDGNEYNIKKQRHIVETLQSSDFNYMTDELTENLKIIAEYIEDETPTPVQSYEMLTLNAQDALLKGKENPKQIEEIKERCFILMSKALKVNAIKEKEKEIKAVLSGENTLESIEALEVLKNDISHLANLSLGAKGKTVKTTFSDEVTEVRVLDSETFVPSASEETEVQKVLSEYIKNIPIIEKLRAKSLISDDEIYELKHEVFDYEKIVEDKLQNSDEFKELMQKILTSSKKEIANKIFDNFIEAGSYTQKQIEVSNKIKNILFGKQYVNLKTSLNNVNDELMSEIHPLASAFEGLDDEEQDAIVELIQLLAVVDSQFGKFRLNRPINNSYAGLGAGNSAGMVAEDE